MAKNGELSPQQEKFCQSIADGKNQSDAYREAYPRSRKWTAKTVNEKASRLSNTDKVWARVEALRADLAKKKLWTRELSVNVLARIATRKDARDSDKISAIRELNLMHGYDEPDQAEQTEAQPMAIEYVRQDEAESKS